MSNREVNFGASVRCLRKERGLTQTQLGTALAETGAMALRHQVTIARLEAGERPTRIDEAYAIAEFFGVDLHQMTGDEAARSEGLDRAAVMNARLAVHDLAEDLREVGDRLAAAARINREVTP